MPDVKIPALYELVFRREAYSIEKGKWTADPEKTKTLPDEPPQYAPVTGGYARVAKRAAELNEAQIRSGFIHYLFSPNPKQLIPA